MRIAKAEVKSGLELTKNTRYLPHGGGGGGGGGGRCE